MRCGVYVRVSTDDQRDNGYSIDSQLRMIKEYCEKNKELNPLEWTKLMNNYKNTAEEIVLNEYVFI